jgi:hypothetical protein
MTKFKFNVEFARLAKCYCRGRSIREYRAIVIDAIGAKSSHALMSIGIKKEHILVITRDKIHCRKIAALGFRTMCVEADWCYANLDQDGIACNNIIAGFDYIICDDAHQYARKTLPRIISLMEHGARTIALLTNIVPRCGQYSHRTFLDDICRAADAAGYNVTRKESFERYRQVKGLTKKGKPKYGQTMEPYWVVLEQNID